METQDLEVVYTCLGFYLKSSTWQLHMNKYIRLKISLERTLTKVR